MIEEIEDMPEGTICLRVWGSVTRDDYVDVLMPAVRKAAEDTGEIRLVLQVGPDFEDFTPGMMGRGRRRGPELRRPGLVGGRRMAVVTDVRLVADQHADLRLDDPGEARVCSLDELPQAKEWVAGTAKPQHSADFHACTGDRRKVTLTSHRERTGAEMPHRLASAARRRRAGRIAFAALLWLVLFPAGASAAFPGANGDVAFTRGVVMDATTVRFGIDTVAPAGGDERRLLPDAQWPAWAPDGRRVAFAALSADGRGIGIAIANADGSDRREVTADPDDSAPAWSPDGRWLVFHRMRTPAPGVIAPSVYVVRVDGTGLRRLAAGAFPAWGSDGRIAFVHRISTRAPFFDGIHTIKSDGSNRRRVTSRASDSAPDWSPGGTRVVFTRGPAVYKIRADGTQLRRVAPAGEWPVWSPDGARVAFTHRQAIQTVRTDGTAPHVLTRPRNDDFGATDWQPVPEASGGATMTVSVYFGAGSRAGSCDSVVRRARTVWLPATLRGALDALLWGPSSAERAAGDGGWFSSATAGMVHSVRLSRGVARIDFHDLRPIIPNASTSCGSELLLTQLDRTATQFPTVDRTVYSINGSRRAFYEWLQREAPG